MMKLKNLIFIGVLLFISVPSFADVQFSASVTPNSGPIGSQFTYTITGISSEKADWKAVQFAPKWSPFIQVRRDFKSQENAGKFIGIWTVTLTHFETKSLVIPTQSIQINAQSAAQLLPAISVGYQVATGNEKMAFQPAPLRKLPIPWLPILGLLLLALAIAVGLFWLIKKYQNRQIDEEVGDPEAEISADPEADAWAAIALLPDQLPSKGVDILYSQIADILRRYLGAKCKTHLFERTTSEILAIVSPLLEEHVTRRVRHVLRDCDVVKFGKRTPTQADYEQTIDRIKQVVERLGAKHGPE